MNYKELKELLNPLGYISLLLRTARTSSKRREKKKTKRDHTFTLSLQDIIDLINNQKGLCAVSGIPLTYGCNKSWSASLDRIDISKSYTKENVQIVCGEFNCHDQSISTIHNPQDTKRSDMTREKFEFFYERIKVKYG